MACWNGKSIYLYARTPLFIVNGIIYSGITVAFDGEYQSETLSDDPCSETEVDSDGFDSGDLNSDEDIYVVLSNNTDTLLISFCAPLNSNKQENQVILVSIQPSIIFVLRFDTELFHRFLRTAKKHELYGLGVLQLHCLSLQQQHTCVHIMCVFLLSLAYQLFASCCIVHMIVSPTRKLRYFSPSFSHTSCRSMPRAQVVKVIFIVKILLPSNFPRQQFFGASASNKN